MFLLGLTILLVAHLGFIDADPNKDISFSRGAWTDEGMYTSQIKNTIITDHLDLEESTCFVITPLFSVINYMPYQFFGWSSKVSRLTVLLSILLLIALFFFKQNQLKSITLILIPILFFEEHFFHFMHYSLAESIAIIFVFFGCFYLYKSVVQNSLKNIIYCTLFFTCSFLFKIQFLYTLFIVPIFLLMWYFFQKNRETNIPFSLKRMGLIFTLSFIVSLGLYFLVWYLPNKQMIDLVLNYSAETRIIQTGQLNVFGIIMEYLINFKNFFTDSFSSISIVTFFLLFFPLGFVLMFLKKTSLFYQINFLIATSWFILELHKFSMNYLPTRYLLSMYFSMGWIIALVIYEVYKQNLGQISKRKTLATVVTVFSLLLTFHHFKALKRAYDNRSYDIQLANNYFSQYNFDKRPIMGTWASSLLRDSKAITIPFFEDYINHKNIVKRFNPKIIIFEEIEKDVLIKDNIDIVKISDSIVPMKIGKYQLKIAWLK